MTYQPGDPVQAREHEWYDARLIGLHPLDRSGENWWAVREDGRNWPSNRTARCFLPCDIRPRRGAREEVIEEAVAAVLDVRVNSLNFGTVPAPPPARPQMVDILTRLYDEAASHE